MSAGRVTTTTINDVSYVTIGEAARIAGLSGGAIRQWDRRGQLAGCIRTPYGRLVPRDELDKTLARRRSRREQARTTD